jgi:hypothetical protein
MNAKQVAPIVASISPAISVMPPLLIAGGLFALAVWLLSDDEKKKPENAPANAAPENKPSPIPSNSGRNSMENRGIPQSSTEKSAAASVPVIVPPISTFTAPKIPVQKPLPTIPIITAQVPLPPARKIITREDMANIFNRGARTLTRTAAVAALKKLGFGKTAAYDALLEDGRFSTWLQFAPDGIITWKG